MPGTRCGAVQSGIAGTVEAQPPATLRNWRLPIAEQDTANDPNHQASLPTSKMLTINEITAVMPPRQRREFYYDREPTGLFRVWRLYCQSDGHHDRCGGR
jgi:hypothetical protein